MSTSIPKYNVFRFENSWLHNSSFLPSVLPAWCSANEIPDAAGRLDACLKSTRAAAKVWSRRIRAPKQLIQNCKFIILLFDTFEDTRSLSAHELQVRRLCQDRLAREIKERAVYWRQRSKVRAIQEADTNTAFHHAHATVRFRSNTIRIIDVQNTQIRSHEGKVQALSTFFTSIITTPGSSTCGFEISPLFSNSRQPTQALTRPFSEQETKSAMLSMDRQSAPGPDGFGPSFYRAAWSTVKLEVMAFMNSFHRGDAQLE